MNKWNLLGIEPTDDVSLIRKAYASKLKVHHPEDDPEGYQRLREAYDYLIKQQKLKSKEKVIKPELVDDAREEEIPSLVITMEEEKYEFFSEQLEYIEPDYEEPVNVVAEFMSKVEAVYHDFYERISYESWVELLNSDIIWNIEQKRILSHHLLEFFAEHHFLPKTIWLLLEDNFGWKEKMEERLADDEDDELSEFFTYYMDRLVDPDYYSYAPLLQAGEIDFDTFLSDRESGVQHFIESEYEDAREKLKSALEIYPQDPASLRMFGYTLHRLHRNDEAIHTFKRLLALGEHVFEANHMIATILFQNKQYEESFFYCEETLKHRKGHIDAKLLLAKNFFMLGKLNNARELLLELKETHPHDMEVNAFLAKVHSIMYRESEKERTKKGHPLRSVLRKELEIYSLIQAITIFLLSFIRLHPILLIVFLIVMFRLNYVMYFSDPLIDPINFAILYLIGEIDWIRPSDGIEILLLIALYYCLLFFVIKNTIRFYKFLRY